MAIHWSGKSPTNFSPFHQLRNTLQDSGICSFQKGSIVMKTCSQLCFLFFFFSPAFLLPEAHWLSCAAARCHSPQTHQSVCLTWGKGERHSARCHREGQPHAMADPTPKYVQGCSSAIGKIRYTLFFPPGLHSYWHAFCVLLYALGTDSLFLQYSAETE